MPKPSLSKNNSGTIYLIAGRDKGIHSFPNRTSSKVNIKAGLEFELAYFKIAVQHFNPYATRKPWNHTPEI